MDMIFIEWRLLEAAIQRGTKDLEEAWEAGNSPFRKPVNCQLYPIRVDRRPAGWQCLFYHQWSICSAACRKGKEEGIPVFRFVREGLVRAYGEGG